MIITPDHAYVEHYQNKDLPPRAVMSGLSVHDGFTQDHLQVSHIIVPIQCLQTSNQRYIGKKTHLKMRICAPEERAPLTMEVWLRASDTSSVPGPVRAGIDDVLVL
jgi:hypothetical protein